MPLGGVLLAGLLGWQLQPLYPRPAQAAQSGSAAAEDVIALRIRLGVTDREPRRWDGSLAVSNGAVLSLRNWHPRPDEQVQGKTGWSLATRWGPNFQRRPWEDELPTPPVRYILAPGVIADVKAGLATVIQVKTPQGEFSVKPAVVRAAEPAVFLNGSVIVDRVPAVEQLSPPEYQSDFAAISAGPAGEVAVAWVAYRNQADEILLRRFDGQRWAPVEKVAEKPGDIFLVKLGRDGRGRLWAVWSEQVASNWDLYARRFDGRRWSAVERLTDDPQPDIYHNLASDSAGNLWVVWQGFRRGKSDIFARRYDGTSWSPAERVSPSPANDWEPAVAADRAGRVYVAWDTYDKGNYDVMLRMYAGGKWEAPVPIADSQKFEAHVSLTCDPQNRLWAAWNESGTQWGKDAGFLMKREATRLYQWRAVAMAVYDRGGWQEPAAGFTESLPLELREYNDFPIVQADAAGRLWVFFRHRTARIADVHNNTPLHRAAWEIFGTAYDGARWTTPIALPSSQGRTDVRAGFALDGRGNLWAAWPTDNRDFEEFLFERAEVYAARVPAPAGSPAAAWNLGPRAQAQLTIFPVHPKETEDLARIRGYTIQSGGRGRRIYRGDVHRHTEFSMDGNNDGTLQQCYRYALDAASLDFLMVSDHNGAGGPDVEYINWLMQQMADVFTVPGTFTPLYGYERSVAYPNGHRNVIFTRRGNPTLPTPPAEQKAVAGAGQLYEYLKRLGGIAISHTSASGMGTDWRDNDAALEPLVEIYQGDRVSAEYEGAPKAAHAGNLSSAPGGFRPAGYVWNAWAKGYKLGVQASSDHLSTHMSYACTLATDFTRDGLVDAMRRRHSYGATDNMILDYRIESGGREYLQGDIVPLPASADFRLQVKVIGTAPIRQLDIIRSNSFIHTRQPLEREVSFTFADQAPLPGESYYYVRVIQVDDQMAWSSPIWLQRK
jgi:hypothetical protein